MKTYKVTVPKRFKNKRKMENYIMAKFYDDEIATKGFCALVLNAYSQDFIRSLGQFKVQYLSCD